MRKRKKNHVWFHPLCDCRWSAAIYLFIYLFLHPLRELCVMRCDCEVNNCSVQTHSSRAEPVRVWNLWDAMIISTMATGGHPTTPYSASNHFTWDIWTWWAKKRQWYLQQVRELYLSKHQKLFSWKPRGSFLRLTLSSVPSKTCFLKTKLTFSQDVKRVVVVGHHHSSSL